MFILGFYEDDRAFGGPEEGGCWYDTGELVRAFGSERNEDAAYARCRRANHLLRFFQDKNRNVRSTGSMAYSGGQFSARVFKNALPAFFPEERPHYE